MDAEKIIQRIHLWYFRYKDSPYFSLSIYIGVFIVSIVLIFNVVIPQVNNWFSVRHEIEATQKRINIMHENVQTISSLDDTQLDDDLTTATTAIPSDGDVSLLLNAVNSAAAIAGVGLDDFAFQVSNAPGAAEATADSLQRISFTAHGDAVQVQTLVQQLQQKIPLLGVDSIDADFQGDNAARILISYYTKKLPLIRQNDAQPIQPLTAGERNLLSKLKSWQVPFFTLPETGLTEGSGSAVFGDPL